MFDNLVISQRCIHTREALYFEKKLVNDWITRQSRNNVAFFSHIKSIQPYMMQNSTSHMKASSEEWLIEFYYQLW